MKITSTLLLVLLACCSSVHVAWAQQTAYPRGTYACTTANGRQITADRPIRECMDREQRIIGTSGATLAIIQPQKTPQQLALERAEEERRQREERERNQMRAMIPTLLQTYPTIESHQNAWLQQIGSISARLERSREELNGLKENRQATLQQISTAGYTTYNMPAHLQQSIEFNARDINIQQRAIDSLENQLKSAQEQYRRERDLLMPHWPQPSVAGR